MLNLLRFLLNLNIFSPAQGFDGVIYEINSGLKKYNDIHLNQDLHFKNICK